MGTARLGLEQPGSGCPTPPTHGFSLQLRTMTLDVAAPASLAQPLTIPLKTWTQCWQGLEDRSDGEQRQHRSCFQGTGGPERRPGSSRLEGSCLNTDGGEGTTVTEHHKETTVIKEIITNRQHVHFQAFTCRPNMGGDLILFHMKYTAECQK